MKCTARCQWFPFRYCVRPVDLGSFGINVREKGHDSEIFYVTVAVFVSTAMAVPRSATPIVRWPAARLRCALQLVINDMVMLV